MKKNKLSYFLLVSLLVIVMTLLSVALVACNKNKPQPQSGDEAGVYYYDAGGDEYTVVLGEGRQFTMAIASSTRAGSYNLNGEVLTFTSNKKGENQISAVLKNDVITLTYDEAEYRFLKKINYTVTFNSNEGSAVNNATVVNGKKVAKPADPTKNGFIFVGWYEDDNFTTPFSFNSHVVTADTTVFARWVEKQVGAFEFAVDFNANNGGVNPEATTTIGGKLFNLPVAEREGYTFKGWWVSMAGNDVLSYEFKEGMSLDADTTLHALWQANDLGTKLAEPLVNVEANAVKWNTVAGAREYLLKVQGPDGNFIVNNTIGGTVESVNFNNYPAGDYIVTVTAVASTGADNNSVATRVYKNKALSRVSQFSVIEPSMLLFSTVDNAEKYLVTVDCGDKNHNHANFDNGKSTHFNFADCLMQNGGIKFTVTAVANGYASSVSKQFVYAPALAAVTEFELDEQTQKLVWNEVDKATGYMVSIKDATMDNAAFVNVGKVNSIDLKEYTGEITVKVYPVSKMYISSEAATYTFAKQNLATPKNIRVQGTTVSWTAVTGATSYELNIAGSTLTTDTNSIDLAGKVTLAEKGEYTFTVVAKGDKDSLATDPIDARNLAMANTLKYENSVLTWAHVLGAAFYDVQVNDEDVFSVSDGANFAQITLSQAGNNTLKVRFVSETGSAFEWVSTTVYAHTLTFVSDGGSSVEEQYKAVGDSVVLPTPQKEGYDFLNWYNTPKGPESNGAAYKDSTFKAVSDVVLYACYTSKAYTVTYHYGDGGNGAAESDQVYYQKDYQLAVPQANEATSAFGGWFSAPNGNGVQYTDDKGNSLNPWNKTGNAEAYAFWFDDVLSFTLTSNAGRQIYAVMQGSRISQVTEVTIPETYKGVKVGMLSGNAFKNCSNLVTLNIPNTVEVISAVDPFTGCSSLSAINVYAVEGNGSIRYWSADGVLFDNGRLDQQDPSQVRSQISYMPLGKMGSYTIPDGIVEIPSLAFENCALERVVIPSSVTVIGMEAFKNSTSLATIVFDSGSTQALTIADGAFTGCTALETITLPTRLTSIALTKYELLRATGTPAAQEVSTTTGVTNAFVGCKNLVNIYIANGSKTYKSQDGILYSADMTTLLYCLSSVRGEVEVPAGVTTIANGAFIGCNSIDKVTIPSTVTMVGECAFYDTDIEVVKFGGNGFNDVTIGKYAFRNCDDLEAIEFEDGNRVANIGEGAFFGCSELESIVLPSSLKSIGVQAFRGCSGLEEITISESKNALTFGSDAFYNCSSLSTLSLPKNVSVLPGIFSGCTSLQEVIVDEDNPYFTSIEGVLFDKDKTVILFYPQSKSDSEYELPETVTTISDGVFRGNTKLRSITIGKNVTKIGDGAFQGCSYLGDITFEAIENGASLEIGAYAFYQCGNSTWSNFTITLPARTTKVGAYAFANMSYLREITLNEGLEAISDYMLYNATRITDLHIPASVKSIGKSAFYNVGYQDDIANFTFEENSQLETIGDEAFSTIASYAGVSKNLSIVLPEGLKHIGYRAFYYTGLVNVTIPSTVETIAAEAFNRSSKLTNLTFTEGGTKDLIIGTYDKSHTDYNGNIVGSVFESCSSLKTVALPSRVTVIGTKAFYGVGLTSLTFGENSRLKHIGENAFNGARIEELTIPKSVSNGNIVVDEKGTVEFHIGLEKGAIDNISTLEVINFEQGGTEPLSLGNGMFYNSRNLKTINLPARLADFTDADGNVVSGISDATFSSSYSSISDGQSSSSLLENINVEAGGAYYCSVDGVLYTADKSVLVLSPAAKTQVTVDANVKLIARNAFANTKIEEVTFTGGTVDMVIGESAFRRCNGLEEVVLSDNVVDIKESAFAYCDNLTKFTLSASMDSFRASAFTGTYITEFSVSANSKDYQTKDGVIFSKDMKTLVLYPATLTAESYVVPSGVTAIAADAFKKNGYIKNLTLPAGLKEIGETAFSECSALTGVTIPNTVERIGNNAFNACKALGEFKFEKGGTALLVIEDYAFQNSGVTKVEFPANLTSIGSNAFNRVLTLETITFANGSKLDSIGDAAFYSCVLLEEIALPEGLNKIGSRVFDSCSSLVTVTFGEGLREIGDYTFKACGNLETVVFPASLQKMGISTFSDNGTSNTVYCSSLKSVTFGTGSQLEYIPESTFYRSGIERFTIPASVKYIEDKPTGVSYHYGAFQGCSDLRTVTFEDGSKCKEIGDYAFYQCSNLEAFTIPTSTARLGNSAFYGCASLEEIVIPSTATIYGTSLFYYCTSLKRVTLNDKATALPSSMFSYCTSLKQLDIPASVTSFGTGLLSGTGIESFVVPAAITVLPYSFFSGCKSLVSVELPAGLTKIDRSAFSGCTSLLSIEIPDGVTEIAENAFDGCSALESVKMPANLETIGQYVFRDCSELQNIVIPNGVKVLEREVFANCSSLETVKLPSSIDILSGTAFDGCTSLESIAMDNDGNNKFKVFDGVLYNGDITSIVLIPASKTTLKLPDTITQIAAKAFSDCGITSIELPASLTVIGSQAFYGCTTLEEVTILGQVTLIYNYAFYGCSNLTTINIPNSVEAIGSYAFYGCTSLTEITLPTGLTELGTYAFYGCTGLTEVVIPNGVSAIGSNLFANCTSLQSVKLPTSLESFSSYAFTNCSALTTLSMDNDGNAICKIIDGALYSIDVDGSGNLRTTLMFVPFAKSGTLALSKDLYSISSSNVLNNCTAITGYTMDGNGNAKYLVHDGALYTISGSDIKLYNVPAAKSGTLEIYSGITGFDSNLKLYNCRNLTGYTMDCDADATYKVIDSKLYEITTDSEGETVQTQISNTSYRVFDGALYKLTIGYSTSGYKADGTSTETAVPVVYTLYSVAPGRTGTFVIPTMVTGRNIDDNAFTNCVLNAIEFAEGNRNVQAVDKDGNLMYSNSSATTPKMVDSRVESAVYYAKWLYNATTVKSIVIDINALSLNVSGVLANWKSEQTIYFVQSEEEVKAWAGSYVNFSTLKPTVVFDYVADEGGND